MLTINFIPIRTRRSQTTVLWQAPVLTVNGTAYNLENIPDGGTVEHDVILKGERFGDNYSVTLHAFRTCPPLANENVSMTVTVVENGTVEIPIYNKVN